MSRKLTHQEFIDKLQIKNKYFADGRFSVLQEYVDSKTKINCQCNLGHIWPASPVSLLHSGTGCPYCSGNAIWKGFNDLWTIRPDVAKLLKNPDDGYRFGQYSNQKAEFICPRCNNVAVKSVDDVSRQGLSCSACSDGVSYPNKFGRALLKQLPVENIQYEYSPKWAHPYRYDNFFQYKGKSYILEMDGAFHFEDKPYSKLPLEKRVQVDNIKTKNAINQGIIVIRVDCRISKCDYIKESILQSCLSQLFDLSMVDWDLCDKASCSSLVKMACDLYMSGVHSTKNIGDALCVTSKAARDYLKRGSRIGLCDYAVESAMQRNMCVAIDVSRNITYRFDNAKICATELSQLYNTSINYEGILRARINNKQYKGFKFTYANYVEQNNLREVVTNG